MIPDVASCHACEYFKRDPFIFTMKFNHLQLHIIFRNFFLHKINIKIQDIVSAIATNKAPRKKASWSYKNNK